jgi:anti-sigma factor RsiW
MTKKRPLSEEERDELVAFLDGELNEEESQTLETRLSQEPAVRAEADALKQAWDLLDYLPRPEPSPNFTNRTMERLQPIKSLSAPVPAGRRWKVRLFAVGWAAALVLSFLGGAFGYQFYASRLPPGDRELVRELRLIENKRLYEIGDNIDFLEKLNQPDLFGDESAGS